MHVYPTRYRRLSAHNFVGNIERGTFDAVLSPTVRQIIPTRISQNTISNDLVTTFIAGLAK
jgi:hypothetical protein